jgi:MFS family permease
MGHYGDTIGRKRLLVLSMMVGVSTFLVGCIPTYDAIGLWAPALLVGLRLLQGFAVAREQSGAAYATQDAYGLGMSKTTFLWIPIAGNVVAVFGLCCIAAVAVWTAREPFGIPLERLGEPGAEPLSKRDYEAARMVRA